MTIDAHGAVETQLAAGAAVAETELEELPTVMEETLLEAEAVIQAPAGQILAMGSCGDLLEQPEHPMHRYLLDCVSIDNPKICFIGTASGDRDDYLVNFYQTFSRLQCTPTHLNLFRRTVLDLEVFLLDQDIIYVGGGNTVSMLGVWRAHGVSDLLTQAVQAGAMLTGGSAGGLCWFDGGITDSFSPGMLAPMDCLGLLRGSFCPHYDSDELRAPAFENAVASGQLPAGWGVTDMAGLHFRTLSAPPVLIKGDEHAGAVHISYVDGGIRQRPMEFGIQL